LNQIRESNDKAIFLTKKKKRKEWRWENPILLADLVLCRVKPRKCKRAYEDTTSTPSKGHESDKETVPIEEYEFDEEAASRDETEASFQGGRLAIFSCERKGKGTQDWRAALLYRTEVLGSCEDLSQAFGYYLNAIASMQKKKRSKILFNNDTHTWLYLGPNTTRISASFDGNVQFYVLRSYDNRVRQVRRLFGQFD